MRAGEFPSVRQAAVAAGIVHAIRPSVAVAAVVFLAIASWGVAGTIALLRPPAGDGVAPSKDLRNRP